MKPDASITEEERDVEPITDAASPHPVGLGIGAASGALAGATAGMAGGPLGSAVGAIVGAVAGGALGQATAATISPTEEDQYWAGNHPSQEYENGDDDFTYEDYRAAYLEGSSGAERYTGTFEESDESLRERWLANRGESRLSWEQAKPAARAAWDRRRDLAAGQPTRACLRDSKPFIV